MKLANGKDYEEESIKEQGLEVIDNNIVRHHGMQRIPSKEPTAFQKLLEEIKRRDYKLKDNELHDWALTVFEVPSINAPANMFSKWDDDIIDAYNDNFKRYFESTLTKKILMSMELEYSALPNLIKNMTEFLKSQYTRANYTKYLSQWQKAKEGTPPGRDALDYFAELRKDLQALIKEQHFMPHWKSKSSGLWNEFAHPKDADLRNNVLLALYDVHYLTHGISNLATYKKLYPQGIVEVYTNENRFFKPNNRGRISQYGFNKDNPSPNLGIIRSSDVCPADMRKSALRSAETRCPDRLYMEHPKVARQNPDNLQHHLFANKYNSCYVNGLSGSILLEIRNVLFYVLSIRDGKHKVKDPRLQKAFDEYSLFKDYFLLIASLFVYFEGGHTISEIFSVFDINDVKESINEAFHLEGQSRKSLADEMINSDLFLSCLKDSLIETAKFYDQQQFKVHLHQEIGLPKPMKHSKPSSRSSNENDKKSKTHHGP